jgi:hypothetical protein
VKRGGHIDPATGRNRRESGGMIKRRDRNAGIRADGMRPAEGGGIRRQNGRPAERQPVAGWPDGPDAARNPGQLG